MNEQVIRKLYMSVYRNKYKVKYLGDNKYSITTYFGHKYWYSNGRYHREDGPAIDYGDGNEYYYLYGSSVRKEQFNEKVNELRLQNSDKTK